MFLSSYTMWRLRNGTWEDARAPLPRGPGFDGPIIYDSTGKRLTTFKFQFDGKAWIPLGTTSWPSPVRCELMALAYDSVRRRTVLFGGGVNGTFGCTWADDTWEFDGTRWKKVQTITRPTARDRGSMVFDVRRGRTVLFGGVGRSFLNDRWEYDGANWSRVATTTSPQPRYDCAMTYDPTRGRVVLTGGRAQNPFPETWEFDGRDWRTVPMSWRPNARGGHRIVFDETQAQVFLYSGDGVLDFWSYQPALDAGHVSYGSGCPGSAGVPVLAPVAGSVPRMGGSFAIRLTGMRAAGGVAYLATGFSISRWGTNPLPLDLRPFGFSGCRLWGAIETSLGQFLAHGNGQLTLVTKIPVHPALQGLRFVQQAIVADPGAAGRNGAVSNARIGTIQ